MNKLKIYQDAKKEWRWRMLASNGRILAEGGEGYKKKNSLLKTLRNVFSKPYIFV